jgi:hypothetical protein
MEGLLKSDIFFLITSAAVILIAITMLIILGYVLSIARNIKRMTTLARKETEGFFKHLTDLGANIEKEGTKVAKTVSGAVVSRVTGRTAKKPRKTAKRTKKAEDTEDII